VIRPYAAGHIAATIWPADCAMGPPLVWELVNDLFNENAQPRPTRCACRCHGWYPRCTFRDPPDAVTAFPARTPFQRPVPFWQPGPGRRPEVQPMCRQRNCFASLFYQRTCGSLSSMMGTV